MTAVIDPKRIMELRNRTSVQVLKCKEALIACDGDLDKAARWLRGRGAPTKIQERPVSAGVVASYVHSNIIAVTVEVLCETDFVARNEIFKAFVHNLCLHIAAANPMVMAREELDPALVEREREIFREQIKGKSPEISEKILTGKMEKWFSERCLLEQTFVKDDKVTVGSLLNQRVAKLGENIVIRRFMRWQLGERIT